MRVRFLKNWSSPRGNYQIGQEANFQDDDVVKALLADKAAVEVMVESEEPVEKSKSSKRAKAE